MPRTDAAYLEADQVGAVRTAAGTTHHLDGEQRATPMLADLVVVLAGTATRRGEGLGLLWSLVDLDGRTARITGSLARRRGVLQPDGSRSKGQLVRGPVKGRHNRTVVLSEPVVAALRRQHARQAVERLALGPAWVDSGYVFTTPLGTPWESGNAYHAYGAAAKAVGVPGALHTLRHTNATAAFGVGVDIKTISENLGPSTIVQTGDTYGHSPDARANGPLPPP